MNYYNEFDPYAAAWLRNLIQAGHIAPGIVDERSIEDVRPGDLVGFTQCHFFAGIGVWSHALRRAGWDDARPVWTGSCPCQPFSTAGKGVGFDDQRHLWPAFLQLIAQCRPAVVIGEQVSGADAGPWLDLVQTDLEALDYAFGALAFPSAGVGAPHIRDRLYWVGNTNNAGLERLGRRHQATIGYRQGTIRPAAAAGEFGGLADDDQHRRIAHAVAGIHDAEYHTEPRGGIVRLADAPSVESQRWDGGQGVAGRWAGAGPGSGVARHGNDSDRPGPTNGFWAAADWLGCRDGKWRPVEPGAFPLAHGAASRVGRLRAYGNAINAEAARVFIRSII